MSEFLPKEVREGLAAAQKTRSLAGTRAEVAVGNVRVPLLSLSPTGFSVCAEDAPRLRGFVDIYEAGSHLTHCLIVAARLDGETWSYDIKRQTRPGTAPHADYAVAEDAPVALIEDRSY